MWVALSQSLSISTISILDSWMQGDFERWLQEILS